MVDITYVTLSAMLKSGRSSSEICAFLRNAEAGKNPVLAMFASMIDPAGNSEFKITFTRRRAGAPNNLDKVIEIGGAIRALIDSYKTERPGLINNGDVTAAIFEVSRKYSISEGTARTLYYKYWNEIVPLVESLDDEITRS
jgi:hypothetical protein